MKIIAFVPAKGTSERIENKNLKLLDGMPLLLHTLKKLSSMNIFDEIYVDTECETVSDCCSFLENVKIMKRDESLASNSTDGNDLLINEIKYDSSADIYVQVLCTGPFLKKETINRSINAVLKEGYDSSFTVRKEKQYMWSNSGKPMYDLDNIPNSKDLKYNIIESMSLYVIKKSAALRENRRIAKKSKMIEIEPIEAIDVNYPEDFELAEFIASGQREKDRRLLNNIKINLSSAILSDILDDLGIDKNLTITGLVPNIENSKIFGYAKTLKLRKLLPGESPTGIYNALNSYNHIIAGDIIVVESEVPQFAYFGELNANLAIRSGAAGAIIGGATRDSSAVKRVGFPVFSTHNVCTDVRGRATVESISKPVKIGSVEVKEGDIIFGDKEGIIVIPAEISKKVLQRAIQVSFSEKNIIMDILNGKDVNEIIEEHGFF